jgi:ATP-dependent helicase/DNAse subunit B
VLDVLAAREVFSASELETYAQCPFAWFVRHLVGLETIESEAGPPVWGRLAHQVLARTYARLAEEGRLPLGAAGVEAARALAAASLDRAVEALGGVACVPGGRLGLWKIAQRVDRFVEWDADSGSSFLPTLFEYDFGRDGGVELGGLALKGRIDRVDVGPVGAPALVIDYKSGSNVYGPAFADQGALQVPLYMLVLQSLRPEMHLAGGFYAALGAHTRGGMVREDDAEAAGGWAARKSICPDDRFEAELAAVLVAAQAAAAGIRDGVVAAEPAVECPRHCDLGALCRSRGRGRAT